MIKNPVLYVMLLLALGCHWAGEAGPVSDAAPGSGGAAVAGTGGSNPGSGGSAPGSGGAPDSDAEADGPVCGVQTFPLEAVPPDLLLVLDHSGSMQELPDGTLCPSCTTMQKWSQVTAAIQDVVAQTDATTRWGLKIFPDDGACGAAAPPAVAVGPGSGAAVTGAIAANPITAMGSTPTRLAVAAGAAYLRALPDANPKYLVLATDGLPTCAQGAVNQTLGDAAGAVAAVAAAAGQGVPTFVVGIGAVAAAAATLDDLAAAGGTARPGAPRYYPVSSTADLVAVLAAIQQKVSCQFHLQVAPPDPQRVGVTADGVAVARADWVLGADGLTVTLTGAACAAVTSGATKTVAAVLGCHDIP